MSNLSKQILFVGETVLTQPGLRTELTALDPDWHAEFTGAAGDALTLLTERSFHAVVADDTLPDMDGLRFLSTVQEKHPDSHRLIVCELDSNIGLKSTRLTHQCIPKPWDKEIIHTVLERAFARSVWLSNPTVRNLVQRMPILPSPPTFYFELVRALRSAEVDLEHLANRAAQDPALTAKLLQITNSAALGLRHKVTRVQDALSYLGLETTRSLVLLAHTFSYCDKIRAAGFSIERLWQHSLTVGALAKRIAREQKSSPEITDECFLAGLLHDIGKLLLAVNMPDEYSRVIFTVEQHTTHSDPGSKPLPLWQAELDQFGASHAEIGAELMAVWNLPLPVVEALALHHRPTKLLSTAFSPLTAVHVANAFAASFTEPGEPASHAEIDLTYLWDIDLAEQLEPWREACREELAREEEFS
jgi:putative nucleotidyltransferase with HDIG domain